ncbi:MAG TPA: GNAT family N-acetyltransferase [Herpetosiphonaceae bacterium]
MQKVLSADTHDWPAASAFPLEFVQLDDGVDLGRLALAAAPPGAGPATLADWIDRMLLLLGSGEGTLLDGCSFVARSRTGLLGASLVVLRDGEPWLAQLLVAPAYRRQGLGTALLAASLTALGRARYPALHARPGADDDIAFLTGRRFAERAANPLGADALE